MTECEDCGELSRHMYWLNNRHLCPRCAGLREAEAKKIIDALIPKT